VPRSINSEAGAVFVRIPPEAVRPILQSDLGTNLPSAHRSSCASQSSRTHKFRGRDGADADRHHMPHRGRPGRGSRFEQASVSNKAPLSIRGVSVTGIAASYRGGEKRNSAVPPVASELASFDQ